MTRNSAEANRLASIQTRRDEIKAALREVYADEKRWIGELRKLQDRCAHPTVEQKKGLRYCPDCDYWMLPR